jgi:hypothetical protein
MPDWLPGTIVALVAVAISWKSYQLARQSHVRGEAEHASREKERVARARLGAVLDLGREPDASGYIRSDSSAVHFLATLRISNDGERGSGRAVVELFMPRFVPNTGSGWLDDGGQPLDGKPFSTQSTYVDVKLDAGEGSHDAWKLRRVLDDVAVALPAELPLALAVPIPDNGLAVPYRIRLQAEHMDEPVQADGAFRVARPDRSGGVIRS